MTTFGARLHAAVQERGPLCAGIDPHASLLADWGLADDLAGLEHFALTAAQAVLIPMQCEYYALEGLTHLMATIDRVKIEKAASTFASDNGANSFLDALVEADRRFMKPATTMRQVFVVLTTDSDTRDEPNIDDYNKFMNDFRRRRGRAYGVLIRSGVSGITGEFLNNFTRNTDGTFDVLAVPNSVPDKMKAIGARISAGG